MIEVHIPGRLGHELEGNVYPPESTAGPFDGVLFLHGWGSSQERYGEIATRLAEVNFLSLTVDLSGHGRTGECKETVSAEDNLADAVAAYDNLAAQFNVDRNRICVVGSSYGGTLAVLLSQQRNIRVLALRSPALYRDSDLSGPKHKIDRVGLMKFRREQVSPEQNATLRAASQFRGDVLIMESEYDTTVPPRQIANFVEAFRQARTLKHAVIPSADHGLSKVVWREIARELLMTWLLEQRAETV